MPISAGELAQIVWAETSDLGVAEPTNSGDVNKVERLIAQLAASTSGVGFKKRRSVPPTGDAFYGGTALAIMKIADEAKDFSAPQRHLIIWDAGPDRTELDLGTTPPPPAPWASSGQKQITNQLHYTLPTGRTIDVFSREASATDTGAPLVNALTGTGMPTGKMKGAKDATAKKQHGRLAWFLGVVGVVLFVAGGATSALSGLSVAGARNLLVSIDPSRQSTMLLQAADVCRSDGQSLPAISGDAKTICQTIGQVKSANDLLQMPRAEVDRILEIARSCNRTDNSATIDCTTLWRAAVAADQDQAWKRSYFAWTYAASAYVTGIKADVGSSSIALPFMIAVIGIGGLIIALGLGTKDRVAGVWIDTRNRVSLARVQVTLWTVVALSAYFILAMFNVGFAEILASPQLIADYSAYPTIPSSIAAALGIATGSTMLSPLILGTKDDQSAPVFEEQDLKNRGTPFFGNATSGLNKRSSPKLASIADIFMGEEEANADTVDVSRLQNVVITITLVLGFFYFLLEEMSTIKMAAMLSASNAIFDSLPPLGATFASLLAVSHATYLVAKAYDKA
jgi:hypothetical protein